MSNILDEQMDLKIINFINMINNKDNSNIPEPTYFTISTQSAMCCMSNATNLNLSLIVVHIAKSIITNIILKNNPNSLIRGIVVDNLTLRFDESYLKKYKKPLIKYLGNVIDPSNITDCLAMLNNIELLANNSLKKHGRQKKKKDNEFFYNSCSIIVKADSDTKCVNIKLFNNGKITLTGSKKEMDGYRSAVVLLDELKTNPLIFIDMEQPDINKSKISNYRITMINSDFNTNFKIDLLKFLYILNTTEKELFTKFNPEKYRGLIIGFYWNTDKPFQDGKCICKSKCNGKGVGYGDGGCKKVTISIFKSGSIIITGGRTEQQIIDAYTKINTLLKEHYCEIIKLSILDFIDDDENDNEICDTNIAEICEDDSKEIKNIKSERKIIKIKNKK